MAIQRFADKSTEGFFESGRTKKTVGWTNVKEIVKRKLDMIHYAGQLTDLKAPPGNRLEKLHGSLEGLHSIRINDQWRVIFRWTASGPSEVRVADYH